MTSTGIWALKTHYRDPQSGRPALMRIEIANIPGSTCFVICKTISGRDAEHLDFESFDDLYDYFLKNRINAPTEMLQEIKSYPTTEAMTLQQQAG